jgi:23S rRNA pseudouridine2605 synthase
MDDPKNRPIVADYFPNKMRLFPVGRLDKNTTGLLLVTNNGDLANKLMHPKNLIPKIYEAETDMILDAKLISKIKKGVFIGYNQWAKAKIINQKKVKSRILVTLQLHHGKNREIRRLFNKINRKLFSLNRVQYGDLELGNLPLGKYRELNKRELNKVQRSLND